MTYKINIKQDYKLGKVSLVHPPQQRKFHHHWLAMVLVLVVSFIGYSHFNSPADTGWSLSSNAMANTGAQPGVKELPPLTEPTAITANDKSLPEPNQVATLGAEVEAGAESLAEEAGSEITEISTQNDLADNTAAIDWQRATVERGDSLALIFQRLHLSAVDLHNIMQLGETTAALKRLQPGQELRLHIEDGKLQSLQHDPDARHILHVERNGNDFIAELLPAALEKRTRAAVATIHDSLFLSGKRAGLSDNIIMQLVALYGWDIDFAMDIRSGDEFSIIFQETYRDGVKVEDGPILAAEFRNQNRTLRAVRYIDDDGSIDYYAENGNSMRKAFLRTPMDVFRISSHFNPNRKHPVLNRIRAHRGTDYAAPTGTPIKATGDGRIAHLGNKGGYGKTVILEHGGRYQTLYAHMSRYARGLKHGSRVKQGQTIGYVGSTGLATGAHLHYEFLVNGVHRNPVTVKLPEAEGIPRQHLAEFKNRTRPLLASFDTLANSHNGQLAIIDFDLDENLLLALLGDPD
ncbi:MAG: peptidoglycan DD-metalloendopeptidase family protein [Gammaproteobacteria bacterium]